MWRLLLPLALAAAQGTQYGDYGAVKMPAYGDYEVPREAASDDYRRPAAASLDYKYEEENKGNTDKTLNKEYGSGDAWQKSSRKQSKRIRNDEEYSDASNVRSRDTERKYRAGPDSLRANHKRHSPGDEDEFSIEKYIQGINENNLEADVTRNERRTTDRIIRRKPRDRENADIGPAAAAYKGREFDEEPAALPIGRAPPPGFKDSGSDLDMDFREDARSDTSGERRDDGDDMQPKPDRMAMLPMEKRVRPEGGELVPRRRLGAPSAAEGVEMGPPRLRPAQRARLDPGAPSYDNEYYDLKRMRNMRRKPDFNRRPTEASEEENENLAPGVPFAEMADLERTGGGIAEMERTGARRGFGRRTTKRRPTTRRRITTRWPTRPIPALTTASTSTTPSTTTVPTINPSTTVSTNTVTTDSTVTTSAAQTLTPARNDSKELSFAEKSRLSIMKKANRKERIGGPSTTKPPVLIQVTKMIPTIVMVETSTTKDPWMRAHEVSGDSPETLAKVRQLMRAKLVANAKDIRDLTEEWDQEVCDYVDVKLLENAAPLSNPAPLSLLLVLCALTKPVNLLVLTLRCV